MSAKIYNRVAFNLCPLQPTKHFMRTAVVWGAVAISLLGVSTGSSIAEEPAEEFVKALVNARYYDIATEYLESAATSELVSPEFRASIPYERAKMIVRSASLDRSPESQEKKFNQADQLLNQYASQLADPLQKINVLLESANIKIRRAEIQIRRSSNDRLTAKEKDAILKKADTLLRSGAGPVPRRAREPQDRTIQFPTRP